MTWRVLCVVSFCEFCFDSHPSSWPIRLPPMVQAHPSRRTTPLTLAEEQHLSLQAHPSRRTTPQLASTPHPKNNTPHAGLSGCRPWCKLPSARLPKINTLSWCPDARRFDHYLITFDVPDNHELVLVHNPDQKPSSITFAFGII